MVLILLILNFWISKPAKPIDNLSLLFSYDNYIRRLDYPDEGMRVYQDVKFLREEGYIETSLTIYDYGPIGYVLNCEIYPDMIARCELMIFSISFGGGSYDNFKYEW